MERGFSFQTQAELKFKKKMGRHFFMMGISLQEILEARLKSNTLMYLRGADDSHPLSFVHSTPNRTFYAYIISNEAIINELTEAHQK